MLEPTPYNYSKNSDYQQMYSGNPYTLGLDPVCSHAIVLKSIFFILFRFGQYRRIKSHLLIQ